MKLMRREGRKGEGGQTRTEETGQWTEDAGGFEGRSLEEGEYASWRDGRVWLQRSVLS